MVVSLVFLAAVADHPWVHVPRVRTVDVAEAARQPGRFVAEPVEQPDFWLSGLGDVLETAPGAV